MFSVCLMFWWCSGGGCIGGVVVWVFLIQRFWNLGYLAASVLYSECNSRHSSEDLGKRTAFSVDFIGNFVC